ncbi:MAG: Response regulator with CheY-like protein receiver, AAA-type ATPase, and DNA-binding domain [Microgenomates group bacterium GW2011_GWC1_39_12]|nr:MAG: Response regulator with CheY-like protein receiver, AAA-type ATPase, and DNA-binding domain [Microgenomates group bacterium GW2011_GWC1_39_12]
MENQSAHPLKYSSIAISGRPGAGRSTLLKNLKPLVEALGWETFSGGDWARKFAIENGKHDSKDITHHLATDYSDEIDHQIDVAMRKKLSDPNTHVAVESWIAGWNMRGLSHVLKVLLMTEDSLRIDRVVNRDNLSVEEAKAHLRDREDANIGKWKRMYGVTDFWDSKYYDLVINTYSHGPKETLNLVLQALGYFKMNGQQKET